MVHAVREDEEAGEVVAMEEADLGLQGLAAGSRTKAGTHTWSWKKTKMATARIKPEKSLSSPRPWRRLWRGEVSPSGRKVRRGAEREEGARETPREAGGGIYRRATRHRGVVVSPRWPFALLHRELL